MASQETLYSRNKKNITEIASGKVTNYASINKAKKASVLLQNSNGGLGKGAVVVEE